MKDLIREFYRQDPGYRKLSERNQIILFREWVNSQGIEAELKFEQRMISIPILGLLALGTVVYPLHLISDSFRWIQWVSLLSAVMFGALYWASRPRPVIRTGTTSRRSQARSRPELIDFSDSNS